MTAPDLSTFTREQKLQLVARAAQQEQLRRQQDQTRPNIVSQDGSRIILIRGWRGETLRYRFSADDLNL